MNVFCLSEFKSQVEKLRRKNSYSGIDEEIIEHFLEKKLSDVQTGVRLNGNCPNPYIKKRLDGRGGFRVYFLLVIIKESIYLMHVHPKTGPYGQESVSDSLKKSLYKDILDAIESNNLFSVTSENQKLVFNKTA
jgi:hypothetical protein